MKKTINILVTDPLSEEGVQILERQTDFKVTNLKKEVAEDELIKIIPNYNALIVRSGTKATKAVIDAGTKLKIIARAGVGIDNVDVDAATEKGVLVINAPEGNTVSTAEQTMALILSLARKIPWAHKSNEEGKWDRKSFKGIQLYGKTLGVIGLGRIGNEVSNRAKAFGMTIKGYDPYLSQEQADNMGVELTTLEDIYKNADIITVHTPLTPQTKGLIGKNEINMMKESVLFINCARGGIFVEKDVEEALKSKRIAGAAFDTFDIEPPINNTLIGTANFMSTPHLGASTEEAQISVAIETSEAVVDFFTKGVTRNSINFPSIAPEIYEANKPFLTLCDKMGHLLGILREGNMEEFTFTFSAEMEGKPIHIMKLAALKGFFEPILSERVNFINALKVAKERGTRIKEVFSTVEVDYPELISLKVKTNKGVSEVKGTIFHNKDPRIIMVDGYDFEIDPKGEYLLIKNKDLPGVVGVIGTILGESKVNIATMQLGRKTKGSEALTFISVDEKVSDDVITKIKANPAILDAKSISF
ncbi:MAG: phosphoglycerate dehydrogenase [Spirochaetota bacterium]|nr:phosphoglycerate dehydrogenase [Spirochaetota bacterium]